MAGSARTVERMLLDIEHRVLDDIWLQRGRATAGWMLAIVLSATAVLWWLDSTSVGSPHASSVVPCVAALMLLLASGTSGLALARRRYRWCCAAAYCCGLATVIGIGTFWWLRTGPPGAPLSLLMVADTAVAMLTIFWLAVIIMPIERSHPDMRRPWFSRGDGTA